MMTHRGHEDFAPFSPPRNLRNKRDFEASRGSHVYFPDQNCIRRRSLSPIHNTKRDFNWNLDEGRLNRNSSSSTTFMISDSQCENPYRNDGTVTMRGVGGREQPHGACSKLNRNPNGEKHEILFVDHHKDDWKEAMYVEDEMSQRLCKASLPLIPLSQYERGKSHISFPSQRIDVGQHEREEVHYLVPTASGKMSNMNMYSEVKRPLLQSKQKAFKTMASSFPKKFGTNYEFEDFIGTSLGRNKSELMGFYGDDVIPLHASDNYPRRNVKLTEIMDHNTYGKKAVLSALDSEADDMTVADYTHAACHSKHGEDSNYLYSKFQRKASNGFHDMMHVHSLSQHNQAELDYEQQKFSSHSLVPHGFETYDRAEGSHGKACIFHNHSVCAEQGAIVNFDVNRIQRHSNNNDRFFCNEHDRHAVINPSDYESYLLGTPHDCQMSNLRTDYEIDNGRSVRLLSKKMLDSSVAGYETKMQGFGAKRLKKELATYDMCDDTFKRTYMEDKYCNRHVETNESSRWLRSENLHAHYDGEKWIDEDEDDLHQTWTQKFNRAYENAEKSYDLDGDFDDFLLLDRTKQIWHHKADPKYMKESSSSGSLRLHKSQKTWKSSSFHGKKSLQRKISDRHGGEGRANVHVLLDDHANPVVPDTEEFMKLVNSSFLKYSKKLNLNSTYQRRYREPGNFSCFVCIVCHSSSKVFGDVQSLAKHAFMCHHDALRAKHWGLLRAICVLMGWNSFIAPDSVTWAPKTLPAAEAFAQRDDLLLWPPLVIIRNISMTKNNPEEQIVVPIEAVQALLRGKGFVGGKVNVILGKPADQSVMLVKFLPTFPGLKNANNLHSYFAGGKHGREDFERDNPNGGSAVLLCRSQTEKVNLVDHHHLLYGYVGIADDLDQLDFYTKARISIMSKKDIQDLADAPVKADG